jgi:AraC family transcriptional regulator
MFAFYDGWLNVERSMIHTMDRYATESMLSFPGGWVEMRQYKWSRPIESVWATTQRCYMLNLSMSGWMKGGSAKNLHAIRRPEPETIGRMYLIPPQQTLRSNSIAGEARSIRCALDADLFERYLADAPRWRQNEDLLHAAFNISGGQIEWLLRRMYRELRSPDFATPEIIETLAKQLTVEVIRTLKLRREDNTPHTGGLAAWRLRLIRKRLAGEEALPSLKELANLCDMTVRHLSRAFRSETGTTIGRHVEAAMVLRANRMLSSGTPVREVAVSLGYATSGTFAAAFHRATGMLPSEVNPTGNMRTGRARDTEASRTRVPALPAR